MYHFLHITQLFFWIGLEIDFIQKKIKKGLENESLSLTTPPFKYILIEKKNSLTSLNQ